MDFRGHNGISRLFDRAFQWMTAGAILLCLFTQCHPENKTGAMKIQADDPFRKTIVPSQTFTIDAKTDEVLSGNEGTRIVCPAGCFKNSKGDIVTGPVTVELSEALSFDAMVLSNLTTTSNGKPLETGGMIYFNATAQGEQLSVNKDIPVHIEIPTYNKKGGMMAYKGTRDKNGNMNWAEPKELDKFLMPIDMGLLDFLPEGFRNEVDKGMPYRKYKTASDALTDSLYYSLSLSNKKNILKELAPTMYNEPYYNITKNTGEGKTSTRVYYLPTADSVKNLHPERYRHCGIDPAIIKVIKSEKYANTLVATREFEVRLKVIFKTCQDSVLEIYIKNLDKNLFELDSMAAKAVINKTYQHAFDNFSKQRLTNVEGSKTTSLLLKGHYEKQLARTKSDLEKTMDQYNKLLDKKNNEAKKLANDYKKLLSQREKFRMETYGFEWSETGWINIDNGTVAKDWGPEPLEIFVANGKQYDRVYTYVVYTSIKSLYRLNTSDNEKFYAGNEQEKEMLMPTKKQAVALVIGYKGDTPSIAMKPFETGETAFSLSLSATTLEKIKDKLRDYDGYAKENNIEEDLVFMESFYKEEQRQNVLKKEVEFILRLSWIVNPCCDFWISEQPGTSK